MIIAVNTKTTCKDELNEKDIFIFETFSRIIKRHPEHTFVLITEKKQNVLFSDLSNVIMVVTGPLKKNATQWYIWYNIQIPRILKKYKANILISYGTISSIRTKIPQCMIVPGLTFVNQPSFFIKSHLLFYKTFVPRSLKKAKAIITFSQFSRTEIINQYKIDSHKIAVVYKGVSQNFGQIDNEERENVKAKYTDGNEYFIYTGEIGAGKNLLNLLKAFSAFKKRQQSNMHLLISGNTPSKTGAITEALRLFRFKENVQLLENEPIEEFAKVTAAAYAMVYPSCYESFATQPLQAMISGVPVIISSTGVMTEVCAGAALYADPENFKEIAIQMMTLFKDENLRRAMIEKGKIQAKKYDWNITADLLWELIEKS